MMFGPSSVTPLQSSVCSTLATGELHWGEGFRTSGAPVYGTNEEVTGFTGSSSVGCGQSDTVTG